MLHRLLRASAPSAALAALCLALASVAARGTVVVQSSVGFEKAYRIDEWTPVCVRLTGQTQPATGQLELRIRSLRTGTSVFATPVRLGSGPINDTHWLYGIYPLASVNDPEVTVSLVVDGRTVSSQRVDPPIPLTEESQPLVVCLTQDLGGFAHLNGQDVGLRHPVIDRTNSYSTMWQGGPTRQRIGSGGVRAVHPPASSVPDRSIGYRAVDAVVLGNLQPDALTDAQWTALSRWVRDGGTLIVSGGSDAARLRNAAVAGLLPVAVTGVQQVPNLGTLAALAGSAPAATSTAVATGAVVPEARSVCETGGSPLVSARRVGLGTVVMAGFDLASPEIRSWSGQTHLWRALFGLARQEQHVSDCLRDLGAYRYGGPFGYSGGSSGNLVDAVTGSQASRSPGFGFVGMYLFAYILCLVPLNYLFLRWRDKRELAWITAPVIIVLFSVGAYAVGYAAKGGQVVLRYCTVLESTAGEDAFSAVTLVGVFSPLQARYDIAVPDGHAAVREHRDRTFGGPPEPTDLDVERAERTVVRNSLISMWDNRTFDIESEVRPGGTIDAEVRSLGPHRLAVRVTNRTPLNLSDCAIVSSGATRTAGLLAPGATTRVTVDIPASARQNGPLIPTASGSASADAVGIRTALVGELMSSSPAGNGLPFLAFTGWFEGNAAGVAVDGAGARTDGAGLLVVHLPAPGGGIALPNRVPWHAIRQPQPPKPPWAQYSTPTSPSFGSGNSAQSYNQLAYRMANQGDLRGAMRAANQALKLAPNDGNILDTVAEMHQRRKEYALAVRFYNRALARQSGGGSAETHEKYGETLATMGRRSEAIKHLRTAARDTISPWGQKARAALTRMGVAP